MSFPPRLQLFGIIFFISLVAAFDHTYAIVTNWISGNGNWNNSSNWNPAIPTNVDTAIINSGTALSNNINNAYNVILGDTINGNGSLIVEEVFFAFNALIVGNAGTGSFIGNGVNTNAYGNVNIVLGNLAGSIGSVVVSNGYLSALQGCTIGAAGTGTFLVNGSGYMSVSAITVVGDQGSGTLSVDTGGQFFAFSDLTIGNQSTGNGAINISGGLLAVSGNSIIGNNGIGNATVNSGTWNTSGNLMIGANPGSIGVVTLNGGAINVTGTTTVNIGTLVVNSALTSPNIIVNSSGFLKGSGTIFGNVTNAGNLNPGGSIGTLNIVGDYTQTGIFTTEIASSSSNDLLAVQGAATINGGLVVVLLNGYTPSPGTTFTILTATGGV